MMSRVITLMFYQTALGSSPRVWGQVGQFTTQWYSERIIPTRVGTSGVLLPNILYRRDHPHACGDKSCAKSVPSLCGGSSPRVWGQVSTQPRVFITFRIIPTRVGTSNAHASAVNPYKDHPHACGDKSILYVIRLVSLGSSPRVWGQVGDVLIYNRDARIIPTRVGTRCTGTSGNRK